MEQLLREYHHRGKNNFQALSGALELERRKWERNLRNKNDSEKWEWNPLAIIDQEQSRIRAMGLVHEQLYVAPSSNLGTVQLDDYLEKLISQLDALYNSPRNSVEINLDLDSVNFDADKATRLGLVVNEAITNAFKHGLNDQTHPHLDIKLTKEVSNLKENNKASLPAEFALTIIDNGPGFSQNENPSRDSSLGFILMDEITKELGGNFNINGESGTTISLHFFDSKP